MISIIVPIYNVATYLSQCLDSLINQTYRDIEIICVDDGSTDESPIILADYANRDGRVHNIRQENQGIAAARNHALAAMRGEWVLFVDSDDWVDVKTCEMALEEMNEHHVDMVLWPYIREYKGTSLPKIFAAEPRQWSGADLRRRVMGPIDEELRTPDTMDAWGTVWGKLYKAEIIRENHILFEDTRKIGSAEDVLFNLDYLRYAKSAQYMPQPMYHYRKDSGNSYTSRYQKDLEIKWSALYAKLQERVDEKEVSHDKLIQALSNRISLGIIGLGLNELFSCDSCISQYKRITLLLQREAYRKSIACLSLAYFPIHWRCFFGCAKHQLSLPVYAMLYAIALRLKHK